MGEMVSVKREHVHESKLYFWLNSMHHDSDVGCPSCTFVLRSYVIGGDCVAY